MSARLCGGPACLDRLPSDANPKRLYCSRACQSAASYLRNRDSRQAMARAAYRRDPEPRKSASRAYYARNARTVKARVKARRRMLKQIGRIRRLAA